MKKYIKYIASVALVLGFLSSCEEDLLVYDTDSGFVQVESTSASIAEDGGAVTAKVLVGSGKNDSGVTVNFNVTVDGGDASRYTISPANGVLEIPAGSFEGEITVTAIDNLNADGDVVLTIDLAESTSIPIGVGGEGKLNTQSVLTIIDNDCPTMIADSYAVRVLAFGDEAPSHNVEMVPVTGTTNQFTVASTWGPNFVGWATGDSGFNGRFLYSATITINDDFTVDVVGNDAWATGGTGTYASCPDEFTFTVTQGLFTNPFTVDIIMTGM